MSTTAQWVFEKAMSIADQLSDTGQFDNEYNVDLKARALPILNVLRFECAMASGEFTSRLRPGKHFVPNEITSWEAKLDGIDDAVAQGAMPYGLAAHLMLDEDPDMASFCNQRYEEMLAVFRVRTQQVFEPIEYPYGQIDQFNEGSRW